MASAPIVGHHTFVTPVEQKIIDLSAKVITLQEETPEFDAILAELRDAIHAHLSRARDKVADLAFAIASESESKAAETATRI